MKILVRGIWAGAIPTLIWWVLTLDITDPFNSPEKAFVWAYVTAYMFAFGALMAWALKE